MLPAATPAPTAAAGWVSVILPGRALWLLQIVKFRVKLFPLSKVSPRSGGLQGHSFRVLLYGWEGGCSNRTELGWNAAVWCGGLSRQIHDCVSILCPHEFLIIES